jgi:hypothetical protein
MWFVPQTALSGYLFSPAWFIRLKTMSRQLFFETQALSCTPILSHSLPLQRCLLIVLISVRSMHRYYMGPQV